MFVFATILDESSVPIDHPTTTQADKTKWFPQRHAIRMHPDTVDLKSISVARESG